MSVVNPALVKEISSQTRNGTTIYIELQRVEQKIHKDEIFGYDSELFGGKICGVAAINAL
ncbi:hypothetical protein HanPSC8_Chr05g0192311 [Helianthus annuus]|nr:hypothetical protein HanPSC8_Chr05g0192311 [Helianthus annuus]